MPEGRYIPILTGNQINRVIYYSLLILLGMLYIILAVGIIALRDAPLSRFIGMTPGDSALLFDVAILIAAPMGLIIYRYLYRHRRKQRILRQQFLATHAADRLVVTRYNPHMVYKVIGSDPASGRIEVVAIWNASGPTSGAKPHISDISAFEELAPVILPDR